MSELTDALNIILSLPSDGRPKAPRDMSDDLVKRLRKASVDNYLFLGSYRLDVADAADEIERLRAENARLREALEPFVDEANRRSWLLKITDAEDDNIPINGSSLTNGDLRRARAALEGK